MENGQLHELWGWLSICSFSFKTHAIQEKIYCPTIGKFGSKFHLKNRYRTGCRRLGDGCEEGMFSSSESGKDRLFGG